MKGPRLLLALVADAVEDARSGRPTGADSDDVAQVALDLLAGDDTVQLSDERWARLSAIAYAYAALCEGSHG